MGMFAINPEPIKVERRNIKELHGVSPGYNTKSLRSEV
jgi:hypothetical protein